MAPWSADRASSALRWAEVRQGGRSGLRTLAAEDDLGMELIHALDEVQQKIAIVALQDQLARQRR